MGQIHVVVRPGNDSRFQRLRLRRADNRVVCLQDWDERSCYETSQEQ